VGFEFVPQPKTKELPFEWQNFEFLLKFWKFMISLLKQCVNFSLKEIVILKWLYYAKAIYAEG